MNIRLLPCIYVDKGGAVKVTYYKDGFLEIEPVYDDNKRYRLVVLTYQTAALVEVIPFAEGTIEEMLDFKPSILVPSYIIAALREWDPRQYQEIDIYTRVRGLSQLEYSNGVAEIYYTWIRDGAYDEQIHRHKNKLRMR